MKTQKNYDEPPDRISQIPGFVDELQQIRLDAFQVEEFSSTRNPLVNLDGSAVTANLFVLRTCYFASPFGCRWRPPDRCDLFSYRSRLLSFLPAY